MDPLSRMPGPAQGQDVPGLWFSPARRLKWEAGTGNVVRTTSWSTPVLDLFPWFRGAMGEVPDNVQPVWRAPWGAGGQLWIWISGFSSLADSKTAIRVTTTEEAHPVSANTGNVGAFTQDEDHTLTVSNAAPNSLLNLVPPGGGYPIRFWRVTLTIEYTQDHGADPTLAVVGAYY